MSYNRDDIEIENNTLAHNSRYFSANLSCSRHERKIRNEENAENAFFTASSRLSSEKETYLKTVKSENEENEASNAQSPRKRRSLGFHIEKVVKSPHGAGTGKECVSDKDHISTPIGEEIVSELIENVDQISIQMDKNTIPVITKTEDNKNQLLFPNENENNQVGEPLGRIFESGYNWDDIEIENDTLAHNSRYFFANLSRSRHERKIRNEENVENAFFTASSRLSSEKETYLKTVKSENEDNEASNAQSPRKRNNSESHIERADNVPDGATTGNNCASDKGHIIASKGGDIVSKLIDDVDQISTQMDKNAIPVTENNKHQLLFPNENENNQESEQNKVLRSRPNIRTPSKWVYGAVPKQGPQPPKAYEFRNVYQSKRQEALRKQREEERKMREFNSRPAPNFKLKPLTQNVHFCTIPVTPQVLKRSKESIQKRLEKMEELKHRNEAPEMKNEPKDLQPRPYNLRCERRVQERKKFDEAAHIALEEKLKEEEEKRKQQEEAHIKEIRKATTFKARPNPFKH